MMEFKQKSGQNVLEYTLILAVIVSGLYSCSSGNNNLTHSIINLDSPDSYYFEMLNSENVKILEGVLKVENVTDMDISGTYTFTKIYDEKFSGISVMKGNFSGQRNKSEKTLSLNMNPKVADNNIFVNLTVMKYYLMGSWIHSTMKGPVAKGVFTSYKQ